MSGIIKEGVEHWWRERLTAVALIPPALWFIASMIAHAGSDYNADDGVATGALFYHTALGLQVIIEDYVHSPVKLLALIIMRLSCFTVAAAGVLAFPLCAISAADRGAPGWGRQMGEVLAVQ